MNEENRRIKIEGKNVDIRITPYDLAFDGNGLRDILKEEFGVEEYEDSIEFRGKVLILLEEIERDIEIKSDFKKEGED